MESSGQPSLFELSLDQESIGHLSETARWGKFLAIVGFVTCGLLAILSFFVGSIFASSPLWNTTQATSAGSAALGAIGGIVVAGIYLGFAAIYFFPCLFLYNFSVRMRTALNTNDQIKLNQSLKAQKTLFRYVGILTIVGIAMEVLALLVVGIVALTASKFA